MNIICSNTTIPDFVPVIVDINKKKYEKGFVQVEFALTDPSPCSYDNPLEGTNLID
jgi:hypothetical protein